MLELRPEPPDEPPELLEELLDDGEELGEDGIDDEEDDCWLGQPPMRNAQTAPIAVACAATTGKGLRER
jgi:hypothetical protein